MSANLIIGSSHALLFSKAIGDHTATYEGARDNVIPIQSHSGKTNSLLYTMPRPGFLSFEPAGGKAVKPVFGPPIEEIRAFNSKASKVFLMLGGNEPSSYFFYRNPKPFDLVLPDVPHVDPSRQILPAAIIRGILADRLAAAGTATEALARQVPQARKFYVSAPPPIPSEEHIRKFPEIFDFEKHGIEDRFVRLKIYRLHMQHMRDLCARAGISFVDSSVGKVDEDGFLLEAYWEGCTHATVDYYRDIVDALEL